jgi:hypothetical protein
VSGMDDKPSSKAGRTPLPRREPGASLAGFDRRAVGVVRVRLPIDGPRAWTADPDEPLVRRVHSGLEALR